MPGRPPKSTNTLRGTVDGIAFTNSVKEKKKIFEDLRAAQKTKQEALEAESKILIDENDSSDDEVLSLQKPKGGKSRRHPRRSRKNKQSRRRRQRHH